LTLTKARLVHQVFQELPKKPCIPILLQKNPDIPKQTLTWNSTKVKESVDPTRPELQPLLVKDLLAWIVVMQSQGCLVSRDTILMKSKKMYLVIQSREQRISPQLQRLFQEVGSTIF
jgi:hypothetical protein